MTNLLKTALHAEHQAAGARLVPFAGWEMPVQYAGVLPEVRAVRTGCGVFDVSHMCRFSVMGSGALASLQAVVSANWCNVPVGRSAYAVMLTPEGGVLDDVMGYHMAPGHWEVVSNASRGHRVGPQLAAAMRGATCEAHPENVMMAVQGPESARILAQVGLAATAKMAWRECGEFELPGGVVWVARGGYTGCDGFELVAGPEQGVALWRGLLAAGATPCGLGARDVLRLEAGLPLYGHELREEWTPQESGVGFAVSADKAAFVGREGALRPPLRFSVALQVEGRGIPRDGYPVVGPQGEVWGEVTSGTLSPTLQTGVALASVTQKLAVGDMVGIKIRHAVSSARVVKRPFVPTSRLSG